VISTLDEAGSIERGVERAPDDAGCDDLGIADHARFVDVFASEADVSDGRSSGRTFPTGTFASPRGNFAALLRRVVFVGQSALGARFDLQRGWSAPRCIGWRNFSQTVRLWSSWGCRSSFLFAGRRPGPWLGCSDRGARGGNPARRTRARRLGDL
jgi:hypothetical protein